MGQRHSWMKTLSKRRKKALFIPRVPLFQIGNLPWPYQFTVMSSMSWHSLGQMIAKVFGAFEHVQIVPLQWWWLRSQPSQCLSVLRMAGHMCFMDEPWIVDIWHNTYWFSLFLPPSCFSSLLPLPPSFPLKIVMECFIFSRGYIDYSSKLSISCCVQNIQFKLCAPFWLLFLEKKDFVFLLSLSCSLMIMRKS